MSYKYIASDLDGTTLVSGSAALSKKIIDSVLNYQKASGNKFFIATGRNVVVCSHFAKQFKITLPIVTLNGAVIYDLNKKEVLYEKLLDKNTSIEIFDFCIENDILAAVSVADKILLSEGNERIIFYENELKEQCEDIDNAIKKYTSMDAIRFDVICEREKPVKFTLTIPDNDTKSRKKIDDFIKTKDVATAWAHIGDRMLLDIFDKKANKGEAIKFLAKNVLKIDEKEIIALGDNNNDLEFVGQSKYGIVPANCVEPLKKIAFKVLKTTANEDCMAGFIEELIKNKGEVK